MTAKRSADQIVVRQWCGPPSTFQESPALPSLTLDPMHLLLHPEVKSSGSSVLPLLRSEILRFFSNCSCPEVKSLASSILPLQWPHNAFHPRIIGFHAHPPSCWNLKPCNSKQRKSHRSIDLQWTLDIISSNINPFQFGNCRLAFKVSSIKRVRAKDSCFVWRLVTEWSRIVSTSKTKTLFKLDCNLIIHETCQ